MNKYLTLAFLFVASTLFGQAVSFEEYDLPNGLHVILHQDNTAPVVTTSVMYHVGAKDEQPERTGFAHFFEHLLFEGTKNIENGAWFSIVTEMAAPTTPIPQMTELITTKYSPQTT